MIFTTKRGLPRVDLEHVPDFIRIDRLTTESAVRGSRIFNRPWKDSLYQLWRGDTCIMIGTTDDIAGELGISLDAVHRCINQETLFDKQFRIKRAYT